MWPRRPGSLVPESGREVETISIVPLRTGWDPMAAGPGAYPPDLPPEWRLSYFANAYWGVLVPARLWRGAGRDEVQSWVADTPPRFRFFLDLGEGDPDGPLAPACDALGDRLGGLVVPRSAPSPLPVAGLPRWIRVPPGGPEPRPGAGMGLAWEVPADLVRDLRQARGWIEAKVRALGVQGPDGRRAPGSGRPPLALLGDCRFDDLERWQTMFELMGLA